MLPLDHGAAVRKVMGMATYPGAIWKDGPADKQGYPSCRVNAMQGVILHSMVGSFDAAMARLASDDRASWHYSVRQDGTVYVHYPDEAVAWHAGSRIWNSKLIGIEHEGGAPGNEGEPLTDAQKAASVALVRWLSKTHGFPLVRFDGQSGALYEHNQVYATACPSGRIPWDAYMEERMKYTDEKLDEALDNILGTLATKADDQKVNDLANAVDALPPTKNGLRFLWAAAAKAWPFGG